jgi:hypothetical protein
MFIATDALEEPRSARSEMYLAAHIGEKLNPIPARTGPRGRTQRTLVPGPRELLRKQ